MSRFPMLNAILQSRRWKLKFTLLYRLITCSDYIPRLLHLHKGLINCSGKTYAFAKKIFLSFILVLSQSIVSNCHGSFKGFFFLDPFLVFYLKVLVKRVKRTGSQLSFIMAVLLVLFVWYFNPIVCWYSLPQICFREGKLGLSTGKVFTPAANPVKFAILEVFLSRYC